MRDVMIIAHRGANRDAPQNTMPAFSKACELCADGVETDVHMTKDGHIVLCHNYTVDKTSDGKGKIADHLLSQLLDLDFGSYFFSEFKNVRIPTIDDFMIYLKNKPIKVINIEIKSDRDKSKNREIARKTIEAAKKYDLFDRLLISSFDGKALIDSKDIDGECKTALLYPRFTNLYFDWVTPPLQYAHRIKADAVHPMARFVDRQLIRNAHKLGLLVNVWTVNSMLQAAELIKMGADGIITDCPFEIRTVVE